MFSIIGELVGNGTRLGFLILVFLLLHYGEYGTFSRKHFTLGNEFCFPVTCHQDRTGLE